MHCDIRYTSPIKQAGVTLLELLLVLVIGGTFLFLGMQTYQQLHNEQQLTQVEYNVNVLFQGLRNYYFANCIANRNYSKGTIINTKTGQLDPAVILSTVKPQVKVIDITKDLVNLGYLVGWPPSYAPLFITDYRAQFNFYNNSVRNVNFCVGGVCDSLPTKAEKNVYLWTIQVAIKVSDSALAKYYQGRLGANCISVLKDGAITPCSQITPESQQGTEGSQGPLESFDYLVFERLPSMALSSLNASPLWVSMPLLKNFNRQYTNDDDYAVTVDDPAYNDQTGYQNYLCGG